jgi:hypothetical protein
MQARRGGSLVIVRIRASLCALDLKLVSLSSARFDIEPLVDGDGL